MNDTTQEVGKWDHVNYSKPNLEARIKGQANKQEQKLKDKSIEDRIRDYSRALVNGHNKRDAYAAAGYSCPTFSNAAVFHDRYHVEIDRELRKHLYNKLPTALQVIEEIMVHGKSETARVKASLEIMDRCGWTKETKIQISNEEPKDQQQLKDELKQLLLANPDINFLE